MAVSAGKIRNICLMGHGGDGKTSLAESMLYLTRSTDRLGRVTDGNTVCDYDPEEIKRQISISTAVAPVEFAGGKINILDTPGFFDFVGDVLGALRVADTGIITMTAKGGLNVGAEKAWRMLAARKLPRMIYVGKLDEENADFFKVFGALREKFGISVCPITVPVIEGGKVAGVANVVTGKAYKTDNGKTSEIPMPASLADKVTEYRDMLKENVAETSEELMEKYFGGEEFTDEEFAAGIRAGVLAQSITPVFCGSAVTGAGTEAFMQGIMDYAPSPEESKPEIAEAGDKEVELKADPKGPACAIVFKTAADQYGRFSFFKVISGEFVTDMSVSNPRTGSVDKLGHIYVVRGKKNTEVDKIGVGDIGAVAKLTDTKTGDTLCAAGSGLTLAGIGFPRTCYSQSIVPKSKGAEDKIAAGLARLKDEDPVISSEMNVETKQQIISGMGDIHLDVICSKLKNKFGVDVELEEPRVPYREKIRKMVQAEGKHKKQSGGHGQYGHVKIEFEPTDEGDFIFGERIFGGSVPKNFHPAVEKGLRESMQRGVLAGYPVVGLKATLYDGSYHDVDSNELSFKMAARIAFKNGLPTASPVLLEPFGLLKVTVPDEFMGDIIGDLNKRRGRVMGMNPTDDGLQMIEAEVPMAEMHSYAIDLRSMTRGWGSFELDFTRYEDAPPMVQQQVIEAAKQLQEEEEDE